MFTPTNIWTPGIASLSPNSPQRKRSTASSLMRISGRDYAHAQQVWATFGCKTLGDYSDLYCRTDVLLLADVFETPRKTCLRQYGLESAHYYTSPGLSWDALLKKTGVELELLTDYDQHLFVEKGMRGGILMVSKRHAKANNPLVDDNPEEPSSHISMVGPCVNISPLVAFGGWMTASSSQKPLQSNQLTAPKILYSRWTWSTQKTYTTRTVYIRWHQRLWWFRKSGCQSISTTSVGVAPTEVEKRVPNLHNKDRHVLHYRNLQLYMSLGMRLAKVHRAVRFDQSPWMEPYIRMNTEIRKKAASDFEKDLDRLMNNSVFGKTMENLRKRVDVKLVRSHEEDKLRRLIASPAVARANIFDKDLAAIQVHKSLLVLNRLVYVGMSILDLSKHLMYDFYYNQLKVQYGESCQLLYTDTDSLLLEIETEDVYKEMAQNQGLYDTFDYP